MFSWETPHKGDKTIISPLQFFFVALLILSSNILTSGNNLSYSRDSNWININSPSLCFENHLCTPSGKSFDLPHVRNDEMCSFLVSKNITHMHFYGDSFMRHVFVATSLSLMNNYRDASLSKDDAYCRYGNQFSEELRCRSIVVPSVVTCNGSVVLSLHETHPPYLDFCRKGHLNFWSEGNHPVDWNFKSRLGVNDPVEYQKKFMRPTYGICPALASDNSTYCSLIWISTHARRKQKFHDEGDDKVRLYNERMRMFFEEGKCGNGTGYIDVFNMTSKLMHQHHEDTQFMSFDAAHWGMEVNLVKVQIIMTALKIFIGNN